MSKRVSFEDDMGKLEAIVTTCPASSVRVTVRLPCSQVISRPCLSVVFPLALCDGRRKTIIPAEGVQL